MLPRRFTLIRLRFNVLMSQFDIFADVMPQRNKYETGVWLSGLDVRLPHRAFFNFCL
jgi:hypothetical protein